MSDGGGRPGPHPGLDLARACAQGTAPIIWLDALDVPLHHYMGTGAFQPGPVADMPETVADAAFAVANVVPDMDYATRRYSPVFRYPYATAAAAVAAAPPARDGSRRVRYINPLNGGTGMALIDCFLVQLDPGMTTLPFRTKANSVCCVIEGQGESQIGNNTMRWTKRDIFTLPQGNRIVHNSAGGAARLFRSSDRDIFARLGLPQGRIRQPRGLTSALLDFARQPRSAGRSQSPRITHAGVENLRFRLSLSLEEPTRASFELNEPVHPR